MYCSLDAIARSWRNVLSANARGCLPLIGTQLAVNEEAPEAGDGDYQGNETLRTSSYGDENHSAQKGDRCQHEREDLTPAFHRLAVANLTFCQPDDALSAS